MILVYNPKSGSSLGVRTLRTKFRNNRLKLESTIAVDKLNELDEYIERGKTIAVVGGDGTISAVAAKVAGTKAVLAPLPGGTLNHFTKDLGISQNLDEAIAALTNAEIHTVDVAQVNERVFINNSSLGMYPSSLRTRERYERFIGKWPAAIIAAVRGLIGVRAYTVTIAGETFKTPFVFVGNNEYKLDDLGTANRTALDAGLLCVFIAKTVSRWKLLKIALWTLIGKVKELDEFELRNVTSLTIQAKRPHHISYDGEVTKMHPPLEYKVIPGGLRILR